MVTLILGLIIAGKLSLVASVLRFSNLTTLVKATRNRSGACDNLDTLVCVKPAVLAF